MEFVWQDYGVFTLPCMLVGLLIVVDFPVMFFSSQDDMPTDTPAPCLPFSQLAPLNEQLSSSGPNMGRAVQAASVRMLSYFS